MKKIFAIIAVVSAAAFLFSCAKPESNPDKDKPNEKQEVEPVSLELTFELPSSGEKTSWVAGDKIVVHGEYAKDAVTVTLAQGDIKDGGRTATLTVDNLKPYVREDVTSTLYAGWPAEAVELLPHCFFYTKFNTTDRCLLAACNDAGNKFQFKEVLGKLTFSVDGGYDSFTITGNKKENLGYSQIQVKITDKEQIFNQYNENPVITLDMPAGAENTIYLPAGTEFKEGLMIKFRKNGAFVKALHTEDPFIVGNAQEVSFEDITSKIKDYDDPFSSDIIDLDENGNANSYVVGEAGVYKFKAVYGNVPTSFIDDIDSVEVLWETWNDASELEPGCVLTSVSYAEDYIIFHTATPLHSGNAVIAAKDKEGKILWSWHIWIPQTAIQTGEYGGIMGGVIMDRNLGALVATKADMEVVDPLSYGLVYQWGRKDPFVNSPTALKNDLASQVGEPEEVASGQISLADGIAHPRLLGHINDGNWMDEVDETLWSDDAKTIYDPCPVGYRVPPRDSNQPFWSGDLTSQTGWGVNNAYGWITIGDPVAVFPIAGYRDDYDVGGMAKVGARTLYWTAHGSEAKAAGADLRYDKGTFKLGSAPKARLASVRCIAE